MCACFWLLSLGLLYVKGRADMLEATECAYPYTLNP